MNCPECNTPASLIGGGPVPRWACPECGTEFQRVPVHDPRARHTQDDEGKRRAHQRRREESDR